MFEYKFETVLGKGTDFKFTMRYVQDAVTGLHIGQDPLGVPREYGVLCIYADVEPSKPVRLVQSAAENVKARRFREVHKANLDWLLANGFKSASGYDGHSGMVEWLAGSFISTRVVKFTKSLEGIGGGGGKGSGFACCMEYFLAVAEGVPLVAGLAHMKPRTAVVRYNELASLDGRVNELMMGETEKFRKALGSHFLVCTKYGIAPGSVLKLVTDVTLGFPAASSFPRAINDELAGKLTRALPAYGEFMLMYPA